MSEIAKENVTGQIDDNKNEILNIKKYL